MTLRGYRYEWPILALIALATLPLVSVVAAQDTSRLAATESIVLRGSLNIDPYWKLTTDRAFHQGHWYSDKAPGVTFAAVPLVLIWRAGASHPDRTAIWQSAWWLWAIRLWTGGIAFLALVFLIGRAAEGRLAGAGALCAVTFGLGTMAGSLGPTMFAHLPDALALFGAFLVATRAGRSRGWAAVGLLAGIGVLFEYPAGLAALVLLGYAAVRGGRRAAVAVLGGALPPAALLGAYDWLAFGAPWRLSYRYTDNVFTSQQQQGLFGVGIPTPSGIWTLLIDGHGLLLVSPVLLAAIVGLVVDRRTRRREVRVAVTIAAVFCLYTAGYFLPNGGLSPGPRFATAALPFLLLGLPAALVRLPWVTLGLAAVSVAVGLFDELTWSVANALRFLGWPRTVWSLAGLSQRTGALLLLSCGAAAALLAGTAFLRGRTPAVREVG